MFDSKSNLKLHIIGTGAILVAAAFVAIWAFGRWRLAFQAQQSEKLEWTVPAAAGTVPTAELAHTGSSSTAASVFNKREDGDRDTRHKSTRMLHIDQDNPVTEQFAELARRAAIGDLEALFYAQALVSHCRATMSVAQEGFSFGEVTAHRRRLLAHEERVCKRITNDPNYAQVKNFADSHANDALVKNLARAIKNTFAQDGAQAALIVGVSGIESRPAIATVRVVSETFGSLGISSYYAVTLLDSTTSIPGSRNAQGSGVQHDQQRLMDMALTLLACDYGMPCGQHSILVSSQCIVAGNCAGADAEQVAHERLFSGQDWADVMTLLSFLHRVPTTTVGWH